MADIPLLYEIRAKSLTLELLEQSRIGHRFITGLQWKRQVKAQLRLPHEIVIGPLVIAEDKAGDLSYHWGLDGSSQFLAPNDQVCDFGDRQTSLQEILIQAVTEARSTALFEDYFTGKITYAQPLSWPPKSWKEKSICIPVPYIGVRDFFHPRGLKKPVKANLDLGPFLTLRRAVIYSQKAYEKTYNYMGISGEFILSENLRNVILQAFKGWEGVLGHVAKLLQYRHLESRSFLYPPIPSLQHQAFSIELK